MSGLWVILSGVPNRTRGNILEENERALRAYKGGARSHAAAATRAGIPPEAWRRRRMRNLELGRRADRALKENLGIRFNELPPVPDFAQFRKECFGHAMPWHQQEWFDVLADNDRVLILQPPGHGKSTSWWEWITWQIVQNRGFRGVIVSQTQDMARKFLFSVKKLLGDEMYYERNGLRNVPREWGPFSRAGLEWSSTKIYVEGSPTAEKDPTLEALGVGNQIYGARADFILLDDIAGMKNQESQTQREKILDWISQEVVTRLEPRGGKLVIIGTRVHEHDIYAQFLNSELPWLSGYHTIVQPAIINEEQREVLWPEGWPFEEIIKRRDETSPRTWSLVYQQQAAGMPDAPFSPEAIEASFDGTYALGHRAPHLTVCIGVDPALTGQAAAVVLGLDTQTGVRYVIDVAAERGLHSPENLVDMVTGLAAQYRAREVRVEKNAMQGFFSRSQDLKARLATSGTQLVEEYTGAHNKFDKEWGVSSVADQFDADRYRLPGAGASRRKLRAFTEELSSWRPGVKGITQDQVMALWFAELAARRYENMGRVEIRQDVRVPEWVKKRKPPAWVGQRFRRRAIT